MSRVWAIKSRFICPRLRNCSPNPFWWSVLCCSVGYRSRWTQHSLSRGVRGRLTAVRARRIFWSDGNDWHRYTDIYLYTYTHTHTHTHTSIEIAVMQLFVAFFKTHKTMLLKRTWFIVCKLYTIEKNSWLFWGKYLLCTKEPLHHIFTLLWKLHSCVTKTQKPKSRMFLTSCVFPLPSIPV